MDRSEGGKDLQKNRGVFKSRHEKKNGRRGISHTTCTRLVVLGQGHALKLLKRNKIDLAFGGDMEERRGGEIPGVWEEGKRRCEGRPNKTSIGVFVSPAP